MSEHANPAADPQSASPAADERFAAWLAEIDRVGEEAGYFQTMGPDHWAFFADEGTTLLVSFETVAEIRAGKTGLPSAHALASEKGWSHLCLIARGESWFRDPAVWACFDRLIDDAFFEDFDRVLFYGAGMNGYAACAFSVAAPGARVLALSPRATLDARIAGWDRRDLAKRRLDFTSRYGYAPAMIEGASQVTLILDPRYPQDAMHAALFRAPHVTVLGTPMLGARPDRALAQLGQIPVLISAAMEGSLSPESFARIWRLRRNYAPYLRSVLDRAAGSGHPAREAKVLRSLVRRFDQPAFRTRLAEAEARLAPAAP